MNVVVDTSVWSLSLRRSARAGGPAEQELRELVREGRVLMLGPIRQELLSGVRSARQWTTLRDRLRAFPDVPVKTSDYEDAASFFNSCRTRGVQGSNTDFLICAVSARCEAAILTTDADFGRFGGLLPIKLHVPRA